MIERPPPKPGEGPEGDQGHGRRGSGDQDVRGCVRALAERQLAPGRNHAQERPGAELADRLGEGEGADHQTELVGRRPEVLGVEGQERQHDRHADLRDEGDEGQDRDRPVEVAEGGKSGPRVETHPAQGSAALSAAAGRSRERDLDDEPRAAGLAIVRPDRAPMAVDDPGRDRQAEPGAAGRRARATPETLEETRQILLAQTVPLVLDRELALQRRQSARWRRTAPSRGLWAIALSTRMYTSWRRRAASPMTVAGSGSTSNRTPALAGRAPQGGRRSGRHVAEIDRQALQADRAGVRAGEQEQLVDEARQVVDLRSDVVERVADLRDGFVSMTPKVFDRCLDDRQRRPQLVAGIGGELALAPQGGPLRCQ